jgi:hypothetical protein
MDRIDAACGLAMVLREICRQVEVWTFSNEVKLVPPRRGFALRDAIYRSQPHMGTYLGKSIEILTDNKHFANCDRVVVLTDEQSHDSVPCPNVDRAYMINVASYKNGVGYGPWTHIDGFSEAIVRYITEMENMTVA